MVMLSRALSSITHKYSLSLNIINKMPNRAWARNGIVYTARQNSVVVKECSTDRTVVVHFSKISSDIVEITVNLSCTYMAIRTLNAVYTAKIDGIATPKDSNVSTASADCVHVGKSVYSSNTKILKAIWNPVAKNDLNLVVLSGDSMIRSYDLAVSFLDCTDEFDLMRSSEKRAQRQSGYAVLDFNDIQTPVSICFGSQTQNDPVGCLTLHVLSKEGTLYSLYPFHAPRMAVESEFIDTLYLTSTALYRDTHNEWVSKAENESVISDQERSDLQSLADRKTALALQLQWVDALQEQMDYAVKEFVFEGKLMKERYVVTPVTKVKDLWLQGPSEFENEAHEKLVDNCDATDVINCNLGPINGVQIGFLSGAVLVVVPNLDSFMSWKKVHNDSEWDESIFDSCLYPRMSAIYHLELHLSETGSDSWFSSTETAGISFFAIELGARMVCLSIDMRQWIDEITQTVFEGKKIAQALNNKSLVKVEKLVDLAHVELVGACLGNTKLEGQVMMVCAGNTIRTISYNAQSDQSSVCTESSSEPEIQEFQQLSRNKILHAEFLNAKAQYTKNNEIIRSFVDQVLSIEEVQKCESSYIKSASFSEGPGSWKSEEFNSNLIKAVNAISVKFVENARFLARFQLDLGYSLKLYKQDLEQQLEKFVDLCELLKNVIGFDVGKSMQRLSAVAERQKRLDARLERLKQKLEQGGKLSNATGTRNMPISNAEKQFFRELDLINKRFGIFRMSLNTMNSHVQFFKDHKEDMNSDLASGSVLSEEKRVYLKKRLTKDVSLATQYKEYVRSHIESLDHGESAPKLLQ